MKRIIAGMDQYNNLIAKYEESKRIRDKKIGLYKDQLDRYKELCDQCQHGIEKKIYDLIPYHCGMDYSQYINVTCEVERYGFSKNVFCWITISSKAKTPYMNIKLTVREKEYHATANIPLQDPIVDIDISGITVGIHQVDYIDTDNISMLLRLLKGIKSITEREWLSTLPDEPYPHRIENHVDESLNSAINTYL